MLTFGGIALSVFALANNMFPKRIWIHPRGGGGGVCILDRYVPAPRHKGVRHILPVAPTSLASTFPHKLSDPNRAIWCDSLLRFETGSKFRAENVP